MDSNRGAFRNNRRGKFHNRGRSRGFNRGGNGNSNRMYVKKQHHHHDQLCEEDVGITEFLNTSEGFTGIIKARYSDFQVNEIDLDGNIAKLTDTKIPEEFATKQIDFKDVEKSPCELISQEIWDGIVKIGLSEVNIEPILFELSDHGKEQRKQIHKCVKTYFGKKIVSSTVDRDGKKFLIFKKNNKLDKTQDPRDTQQEWPEELGEYIHFILYKENMNTADACFELSNALRMKPSEFHHAGNKDRRSVSAQWFSARKIVPWKLAKKTRNIYKLKIGNYTFKDHPMQLGQLQGNKFRIALRNVTADNSILEKAMSLLKENGFINYYGLQRFGNDKEVPTFKIGLSLLQGNWKEAVDLILKPKASDDPSSDRGGIIRAKQIYSDTGNADEAVKVLEGNNKQDIEVALLEGLKKGQQNDYVNALENVPRSMRLLYLHSFQSLLWNKMVSKRIKLFGLKPVEGDLVVINEVSRQNEPDLCKAKPESEDVGDTDKDSGGIDEIKCKKVVKALSLDDLPHYTLYDIVLPLPGYDIVYPDYMKQYYKEALEEHGLSLEMTKQKVKTYTLSGDYRKILEKTKDLSWKVMKYDLPNDTLIRSDFEELRGQGEPRSKENGKYKALLLEFILHSSSYATMAIRDVMKTNTSSGANTKLNDYHEKNEEKRILIEVEKKEDVEDKEGEEDENIQNSLLSDPQKYEDFKNSLFNNIVSPEKRSHDEDDAHGTNKKLKTGEEGGIKSGTSAQSESSADK